MRNTSAAPRGKRFLYVLILQAAKENLAPGINENITLDCSMGAVPRPLPSRSPCWLIRARRRHHSPGCLASNRGGVTCMQFLPDAREGAAAF